MPHRNASRPAQVKAAIPAAPAQPASHAADDASDRATAAVAAAIMSLEARIRAARDETQLVHLAANEIRRMVGARQAIVLRIPEAAKPSVRCVSSLVLTDKDTPFVRWIEAMVARILNESPGPEMVEYELPAFVERDAPETRSYPFVHLIWQPMQLIDGGIFAGILVARETPWADQDRRLIGREAEVAGSAWQALYGSKALRRPHWLGRKSMIAAAVALGITAILPVPMATLAPVEIVARDPQRVTAPIDGVIQDILVEPNREVHSGDVLLRFEQTTLRNRLQLAEQEMRLAKARFDRASQGAFGDDKSRHELAQARAEFELKQAERTYAAELLARTAVVADRDGILVYADKDRWIGRPVKTGERIMQIVDTAKVVARIEVPVADAIVLEQGARVRLFLDANPLTAVPARLSSEGYHAEPNGTQQLVYRLHAEVDAGTEGLRIGARGTAQLLGAYVPLSFYLLRRPISALRQHSGI